MNENFQNESLPPPTPPQQEPQPSVIQSEDNSHSNISGGVSRLFKTAFVIAAVLTCLLLGPGVVSLPTADGWGGIAVVLGLFLVWGFSIAALLFTAFLKSKIPGNIASFIYGSAVGAQAALSLLLIIISVIHREPATVGDRLLPIAIYILATAPILLFVRYMGRKAVHSTDRGSTKTGNFGVISLVLGLVLSLGVSYLLQPDFRIWIKIRSEAGKEYDACWDRQVASGTILCDWPANDGYTNPQPPYRNFGFPIPGSTSGNPTDFSLYFFILVPNWLLWSMAVYLLLSVAMWVKSRMSRHV